jgi:hypothetical protein
MTSFQTPTESNDYVAREDDYGHTVASFQVLTESDNYGHGFF